MWSAAIAEKKYLNGSLNVVVRFDNGTDSFTETFGVSSQTGLSDLISARLASLNATDTLNGLLVTGAFTPVTKPPKSGAETFQAALGTLRSAQRAVDLGIITKADPLYTNALAAAQAAFDPSFLSQI